MTDPAPPQDRTAALMTSLALGLVQAAYVQLGKIRNDLTGKIDKNMDAAKVTIDTLAALELRTRGNRTDGESQVLERALAELKLNYVDELKKSTNEQVAAASPGTAPSAVATGSAPEPPPSPDA
jgi:hypothetical protein